MSAVAELDRDVMGLPYGWTTQQLGQVARIVTGKTPSTKDDRFWNGEVPFVTPSDIGDSPWCDTVDRHLSPLGASTVSTAPAGAVLFTCIASIGKSCILSATSAFNQQINACIPGPSVDSYFLFSQLQAMSEEIRHLAGTTAVPIINKSTFSAIPINLPPLDEQRRIAEVLRSVDEAIAAADSVICGLESAASEIAKRAFADPDTVEIDYEIVTFGDLFDIKGGNQPPKSSFIYQPKEGYVRLLQIRDFESDDKAAYITKQSTNVRCTADDILIARYGASVGRILTGKAGAYNVALTKIVFRDQRMLRRYAYHWLKSDYFQDRIRAVSNRSAQAGFNKEDLFPAKIALPPLSSQADIAEALDDIERAMLTNRHAREQLVELKGALLDDLLSGRVRVPA